MSEKPIWALSATELVKKTINNELSATEVTSAYLKHIKKVNPELLMVLLKQGHLLQMVPSELSRLAIMN